MRPEVAERLALTGRHAAMIEEILQQHIPDRPVWAFGSRAFGRARRYSDLDLAIGGPGPLSAVDAYDLEEAFDQSLLPIEIDVTDLNEVSSDFRERIRPYFVPVRLPEADCR